MWQTRRFLIIAVQHTFPFPSHRCSLRSWRCWKRYILLLSIIDNSTWLFVAQSSFFCGGGGGRLWKLNGKKSWGKQTAMKQEGRCEYCRPSATQAITDEKQKASPSTISFQYILKTKWFKKADIRARSLRLKGFCCSYISGSSTILKKNKTKQTNKRLSEEKNASFYRRDGAKSFEWRNER